VPWVLLASECVSQKLHMSAASLSEESGDEATGGRACAAHGREKR
jgi:hypothetical protein